MFPRSVYGAIVFTLIECLEILTDNPVSCGCNTVELWTWLLNHPGQVQQPRDLTCDLPEVRPKQII